MLVGNFQNWMVWKSFADWSWKNFLGTTVILFKQLKNFPPMDHAWLDLLYILRILLDHP